MKNRHLLIIALAFAAISLPGQGKAQHNFNIPFSQYGIGLSDMPYNMPTAFGMGGTVYARAARNSINPSNPASYAAVETESFVFDIGLNIQTSVLRKDVNRLTDADGNLAYITVAFPITQWWKTSAGLLPYSKSNYESVQTKSDPAGLGNVKTIYAGHGGVSQLYWGNGFNIGERLSLGFNIDFLYGNITRAITYQFQHNDSTYCMNSRSQKNTQTSNLLFDLGLQYSQPVGAKHTLRFGATCRLPRTSTIKDQTLAYTFLNYASPYSGVDYREDPSYNLFGSTAFRSAPNYRFALGGDWKGNPGAVTYWGRIGRRMPRPQPVSLMLTGSVAETVCRVRIPWE